MSIKITIRNTVAPRLPTPPSDYDRSYFDNLLGILRMYFVRIDGFTQALTRPDYFEFGQITFSVLPTASSDLKGAKSIVTDSTTNTFNAVVTGGGSYTIPVFCDGTNWRVG